jgi:hypothetical protein
MHQAPQEGYSATFYRCGLLVKVMPIQLIQFRATR